MGGDALDSTSTTPEGSCPGPASQPPQASTLANGTGGAAYSGATPDTIANLIIRSVNTTVFCLDYGGKWGFSPVENVNLSLEAQLSKRRPGKGFCC